MVSLSSTFSDISLQYLYLSTIFLSSFSSAAGYYDDEDDEQPPTIQSPNNGFISFLPTLKDINSRERIIVTVVIALILTYVLFFSKDTPTTITTSSNKVVEDSSSSSSSSSSISKSLTSNSPHHSNNASPVHQTVAKTTTTSTPKHSSPPPPMDSQPCSTIFEWDTEKDYLSSGSSCKVYTCRIRSEMVTVYPDVPKNLVVKEYNIAKMRKEVEHKPEVAATLVHLMKQAEREYEALSKFRHPQIVRLVSMFREYHNNRPHPVANSSYTENSDLDAFPDEVHVVMERAPTVTEGPLAKTMTPTEMKFLRLFAGPTDLHYYFGTRNRMTEEQVALIMYQVLLAVRELHKVNLVHRDLKPANILVFGQMTTKFATVPICKLGDFGLARDATTINAAGQVIDTEKTFGIGTPLYVAPEAFRNKYSVSNPTASYGTEFDIFSLGAILFNLVTKEFPYDLNSFGTNMVNMIRNANIRWSVADNLHISPGCIALMKRMTNVNGKLRPSVNEVLADPWFDTVRTEAVNMFGQ